MNEEMVRFRVTPESLETRKKNLVLGALLSLILVIVVVVAHRSDPERYNDLLLWSVIGFAVVGNLVNYFRHRRYVALIRDHYIEVSPERIQFWTGGNKTELERSDIAAVFLYPAKGGALRHIQLSLKNNRGIRLEGYEHMNRLAELLQAPPRET